MTIVPKFDRWRGVFCGDADSVEFAGPDGEIRRRPVFDETPCEFRYDRHGYETIEPTGPVVRSARLTPDIPGTWTCRWLQKDRVVGQECFDCANSRHPGYVIVSPHDSRYFCFTDGSAYVPIGLNLCWPSTYALTSGKEFGLSGGVATFGGRDYVRWFDRLAESGGNFARLWLGMNYFQAETGIAGNLDLRKFAAIDKVVELARRRGIRLKLCLEHFRTFAPGSAQSRSLSHPDDGRQPASMDEWFQSPDWQSLWMRKVHALLARYGDDPAVMAWELWNEIDCCAVSSFDVPCEWTRQNLLVIKSASPRNLVTNSLGSFDRDSMEQHQDAFHMPEMDFQQVHRYLDQGAPMAVCNEDPVALSIESVQRARRADRPILLAETGAVNDCHSGPFGFYRYDDDGLIFHDTTYPAFFAGAAGSGHIWHWDIYVDQKNLWEGFRALSDALCDVKPDREAFTPIDLSTSDCWKLVLSGNSTVLIWLRNRMDRWDHVYRDGDPVEPISTAINLAELGLVMNEVSVFRPWPNDGLGEPSFSGHVLRLPEFRHGLLVKLKR